MAIDAMSSTSAPPVLYSVVVPAYNEEALLPATLAAIRAAMARVPEPGELIVVDNNSSDATAEVARRHQATVIFEPRNSISRARNAGGRAARGPYLIFVDADSLLPPGILVTAVDHLRSGRVAGGGALFELDDPSLRLGRRLVDTFNHVAVRQQFGPGCFIYCLREAYQEIGGFDERLYASCDSVFFRALRRWSRRRGLPLRIIDDARVVTSGRKLRHPVQFLLVTALHVVFPFSVYFRSLCWSWYRRVSS